MKDQQKRIDAILAQKFVIPAELEKSLTSGKKLKEEDYKRLFEANPNAKWIFGIDGLPKDSHKYRINQDGEHLFNMMKMANDFGLSVIWQCIVFRYNENDIEKCKQLAKENNIKIDINMSGRWRNDDKYKPLNPKYYLSIWDCCKINPIF